MPSIRVAFCFALALAFTPAAFAAEDGVTPLPAGGLTYAEVRDWLQEQGYRALIKRNDSGASYIESSAEGFVWFITLYDCDKVQRCGSLQAYAFFKPQPALDLATMNRWNTTKRWAAAYIDGDGSPVLQMDINLPVASSWDAFDENLRIWLMMLREFGAFLDAAQDPKPAGKR